MNKDELWDLCLKYEAELKQEKEIKKQRLRLRNEDEVINWKAVSIYWENNQDLK